MLRFRSPLLLALSAVTACADAGAPSAPVATVDDTTSIDAARGTSAASGTAYTSPALVRRPFPATNAWNTDVSAQPVDPASATLIASCGLRSLHADFGTVWDGAPNGIPYVLV